MQRGAAVIVSLLVVLASAVAPRLGLAQDAPVERLALAVNKSTILTLPVEVRDVLVSNPATADVVVRQPTQIYLLARQVGETNVFFFDRNGRMVRQLEVSVTLDLDPLRAAIQASFPGERIAVNSVNQSIFLRGTVASAATAENVRQLARRFVAADENVINQIQVRDDQQVLLRVRVAEMTRQVVKELGFRSTSIVFPGGGGGTFTLSSGITRANQFGSLLFADTAGIGPLSALTTTIEALERNNLLKTLAEPNLTAISGQRATFLAGGEFPVPIPGSDGSVTIQFKEFGIRLSFTPVVLSAGSISLTIETEVSALSDQGSVTLAGFTVPALTTRRATTTVEMPSGGSLVIAGLLQNDLSNRIQGLPGLKDIPILGTFFRSTAFASAQSELVVSVTPLLIRPVNPNDIALPTDGFGPASDIDMFLLGRLHAVHGRAAGIPQDHRLKGTIGFILE